MRNSVLEPISYVPNSSYVITVQGIAQTPVTVQKTFTNREALKKIADYLDKATSYLRNRRLATK